jgi:hypothetical protein
MARRITDERLLLLDRASRWMPEELCGGSHGVVGAIDAEQTTVSVEQDPSPSPEPAVPDTVPEATRSRIGWIVKWRWPVLCVSLILVGSGLTYLLVPPSIVASEQPIVVDPGGLAQAQQRVAQSMPSLLGLNKDVAGAALYDAGLGDLKITMVSRPAAGPVDLVLTQKPSPGTGSVSDIELTVSTPAMMPDVMGQNLKDARAGLEALGAVVEVVKRFDPTLPKDQIVDVVPKAGEVMPTVVTLTVADPGDALTLAMVNDVDSDSCGSLDSATMAGKPVTESIYCDTGEDPAYIEFAVSRNAAAFEAEIGTDDRGRTGGATVSVIGDGRVLSTTQVGLGISQHVVVPIGDVLRLRIEVTTGDTKQNPKVLLGDARLLGLPQGLDVIASQK